MGLGGRWRFSGHKLLLSEDLHDLFILKFVYFLLFV